MLVRPLPGGTEEDHEKLYDSWYCGWDSNQTPYKEFDFTREILSYPVTGRGRLLGFQEVEAPIISRQSAHEGKTVSPTHRPPLPSRKDPWYSFLLEAESIVGP